LGDALVAGKKRVPSPAAGNIAFVTLRFIATLSLKKYLILYVKS
jgi:hypothetical protein